MQKLPIYTLYYRPQIELLFHGKLFLPNGQHNKITDGAAINVVETFYRIILYPTTEEAIHLNCFNNVENVPFVCCLISLIMSDDFHRFLDLLDS